MFCFFLYIVLFDAVFSSFHTVFHSNDLKEWPNLLLNGARQIRVNPYFIPNISQSQQQFFLTQVWESSQLYNNLFQAVDELYRYGSLYAAEQVTIQLAFANLPESGFCNWIHKQEWENLVKEVLDYATINGNSLIRFEFIGAWPEYSDCLTLEQTWPGSWNLGWKDYPTQEQIADIVSIQTPYEDFNQTKKYLTENPFITTSNRYDISNVLPFENLVYLNFSNHDVSLVSDISPMYNYVSNMISPKGSHSLYLEHLTEPTIAFYYARGAENQQYILFARSSRNSTFCYSLLNVEDMDQNHNCIDIVFDCNGGKITGVSTTPDVIFITCTTGTIFVGSIDDLQKSIAEMEISNIYRFGTSLTTGSVTAVGSDSKTPILVAVAPWNNCPLQFFVGAWDPADGFNFQEAGCMKNNATSNIASMHLDVRNGICGEVYSDTQGFTDFLVINWATEQNFLWSGSACYKDNTVGLFHYRWLGWGKDPSVSIWMHGGIAHVLEVHSDGPCWKEQKRMDSAVPLCAQEYGPDGSSSLGYYFSTVYNWVHSNVNSPVTPCNQSDFSVGMFDVGFDPSTVLFTNHEGKKLSAITIHENLAQVDSRTCGNPKLSSSNGLIVNLMDLPEIHKYHIIPSSDSPTGTPPNDFGKQVLAAGVTLISITGTLISTLFWFMTRRNLRRDPEHITVDSMMLIELLQQRVLLENQLEERRRAASAQNLAPAPLSAPLVPLEINDDAENHI